MKTHIVFFLATINPILALARGSINAVYKEMIKANAVNTGNYSMWQKKRQN